MQRTLGTAATGVYIVSTHRAVPGHRGQLIATLNQMDPASKVKVGHLLFTHVEGGQWQFLSKWQPVDRDTAVASEATPSK